MPFDVQLGGGQDAAPPQVAAIPSAQVPQTDPGGVNEKTKQILQYLVQASQRKQMANTAVPAELPGQQSTLPPPSMAGHPRQGSFHTIGALISNAVQKQKQDQLLKAEGDWTYLQSAMNELYGAQQSGDPQAIKAAQAKVDVMMNDPKKLKNMAKALNQDWLAPEKTTVYGEALKNVTAKSKQSEQQKQQAKQGIMSIFKKLIGRQQEPQLSPEQRQQMGREIQAKAPTTATDPTQLIKAMQPFAVAEQREQLQALKDQTAKEIQEMKDETRKQLQKPVDKVLGEAREALDKGDTETYQKKLQEAQGMAVAAKPPGQINKIGLIMKANAGDKEAQAALKTQFDMDKELARTRGESYGLGRAMWNIQAYMDDSGQIVPMSAYDAMNAIHSGKQITPAGRLPVNLINSTQQLVKESTPAFDEAEKHLSAFDNDKDKAIFAKIMQTSPAMVRGQESSWLGNVWSQALRGDSGLSPEGRSEALALSRVNETMGRMRSTLGLPATEAAMALTLSLVPGSTTPDSKYAKEQYKNLRAMVENAVEVPVLKKAAKAAGSGDDMETKTYNGATYKRKKGSSDQWVKQ